MTLLTLRPFAQISSSLVFLALLGISGCDDDSSSSSASEVGSPSNRPINIGNGEDEFEPLPEPITDRDSLSESEDDSPSNRPINIGNDEDEFEPLPEPIAERVKFTEVTLSSGIDYIQYSGDPIIADLSGSNVMAGGAAAGDFDNDGWIDLFVTRFDGNDILYKNNGDGTFVDVTANSKISQAMFSSGAGWADVNNDGFIDLFVTRSNFFSPTSMLLFMNNGDGTFTEDSTNRSAQANQQLGQSVAFGDFDRDGWLDVFVDEWKFTFQPNTKTTTLLKNRGGEKPGYFENVSDSVGADMDVQSSYTSAWVDLNNDMWPDLAVTADFKNSSLFWNNGDGTFTRKSRDDDSGIGADNNGMGMAISDYDNDGDMDWFATAIYDPTFVVEQHIGNRLYNNQLTNSFIDVTESLSIQNGMWGWGSVFLDADNDGDKDLMMVSGMDVSREVPTYDSAIYDNWREGDIFLWLNDDGNYVESSEAVGLVNNGTESGRTVLYFDYDNDGDQDVFITYNSSTAQLYRNDSINENDWLRVDVRGVSSNRDGVGAKIKIFYGEEDTHMQYDEVSASGNFLGQNEKTVHFGLGKDVIDGKVNRIELMWPSGEVQTLTNVAVNQKLLIVEPSN